MDKQNLKELMDAGVIDRDRYLEYLSEKEQKDTERLQRRIDELEKKIDNMQHTPPAPQTPLPGKPQPQRPKGPTPPVPTKPRGKPASRRRRAPKFIVDMSDAVVSRVHALLMERQGEKMGCREVTDILYPQHIGSAETGYKGWRYKVIQSTLRRLFKDPKVPVYRTKVTRMIQGNKPPYKRQGSWRHMYWYSRLSPERKMQTESSSNDIRPNTLFRNYTGKRLLEGVVNLLKKNPGITYCSVEVANMFYPEDIKTSKNASQGTNYARCVAAMAKATKKVPRIVRKRIKKNDPSGGKWSLYKSGSFYYNYWYEAKVKEPVSKPVQKPEPDPVPTPPPEKNGASPSTQKVIDTIQKYQHEHGEVEPEPEPVKVKEPEHGYPPYFFMAHGRRIIKKIDNSIGNARNHRTCKVSFSRRELNELGMGIDDGFRLAHSKQVLSDLTGWTCVTALLKGGGVFFTFRK